MRGLPVLGALALVLTLAVLPGCAGLRAPQTEVLLAQAPADLPKRVELSDTPFFPQAAMQCGPAALATVMGAAGQTVDPQALSRDVFVPARGGSLQIEMLAASRRRGLLSVRLKPDLSELLKEVAAGHPAVVLLNLSLPVKPLWHYAVVIGYDLSAREILLRSGTTRLLRMAISTFEHTWSRSGQWAFVALRPGQLPTTASLDAVTEALVAFERLNAPAANAKAYGAAQARWPDSAVLGMGLGNALYAQGDNAMAAQAYAGVAERHNSAAAWNNLAMAQLKLGLHTQALWSAERALTRAKEAEPRWQAAAQSTLEDVRQAASR